MIHEIGISKAQNGYVITCFDYNHNENAAKFVFIAKTIQEAEEIIENQFSE